MTDERQHTIASPFTLEGIGLHEGLPARVTVQPAEAGHGFVFVRTDLPGKPRVPAVAGSIAERQRRTLLAVGEVEVHTGEHLIAGLFGCGVDNAEILLEGPELPAMDGSAGDFAAAVMKSGVVVQDAPRRIVRVPAEMKIDTGRASVTLAPHDGCIYEYTLDYGVPELPVMTARLDWSPQTFLREIAPARTFCLESEALQLQAAGFGKGANTDNTLVVGPSGVRGNTLRWPDEFARHKLLDLIGDLALGGCRIRGRITAWRAGHALNHQIALRLWQMGGGLNVTGGGGA